MNIIQKAPSAAKLLQGIHLGGATQAAINASYPLQDVGSIKGNAAFKSVQSTVQGNIDKVRDDLKTGLGLEDKDFIHLPVLFKESGGRYVAYTPGVVNMLVVTKAGGGVKLCLPKPFGPIVAGKCQFEEGIKTKLKGAGLNYPADFEFIDDFTTKPKT